MNKFIFALSIFFVSTLTHADRQALRANPKFDEMACYSEDSCSCPPGNNHLSCLKRLTIDFMPPAVDQGGAGYILLMARRSNDNASYILDRNGRWIPWIGSDPLEYSFAVQPVENFHTFAVNIPNRDTLTSFCPTTADPQVTITLTAGYGVVQKDYLEKIYKNDRAFKEALGSDYERLVAGKNKIDDLVRGVARADAHKNKGSKIIQVATFTCPVKAPQSGI